MHRHAKWSLLLSCSLWTEQTHTFESGSMYYRALQSIRAHVFVLRNSPTIYHLNWWTEWMAWDVVWVYCVHYTHLRSSDPIDSISSGFLFISGEWVETSSTAATASAPAIVKKKYHSLNWSFDSNSQAINKYTYSCRLDWLAICKYATGHCDIVNWMRLYFQIGIYWVNEFYGRHIPNSPASHRSNSPWNSIYLFISKFIFGARIDGLIE